MSHYHLVDTHTGEIVREYKPRRSYRVRASKQVERDVMLATAIVAIATYLLIAQY